MIKFSRTFWRKSEVMTFAGMNSWLHIESSCKINSMKISQYSNSRNGCENNLHMVTLC